MKVREGGKQCEGIFELGLFAIGLWWVFFFLRVPSKLQDWTSLAEKKKNSLISSISRHRCYKLFSNPEKIHCARASLACFAAEIPK